MVLIVNSGESFERLPNLLDQTSHSDNTTQRPQEIGTTGLENFPEQDSLPSQPQQESIPRRKPEMEQNSFCPEVIEQSNDVPCSTESARDTYGVKPSPPDEKSPQPQVSYPQVSPRDTVQPMEVFGITATKVPENKFSLSHVLSTPVGHEDKPTLTSNKPAVLPTSQVEHINQRESKASSQSQVSAADAATLTEVIKTVLAGTGNPDYTSQVHITPTIKHHNSEASSPSYNEGSTVQEYKSSPADTCLSSSEEESRDFEVQRQAEEVLKRIQDLGYTVHKEPNHDQTPKIQNAGSAASNKSEHHVVCKVCQKFKGRPCELK